jgi:DNA topoisomerase-1
VCALLEKHLPPVVDVGFTAHMEADLDRIARGEVDRLTVMQEFYEPFKAMVDQAKIAAAAERQPAARPAKSKKGGRSKKRAGSLPQSARAGQPCPHCQQGSLVVKTGKFGPFLGCSRYDQGCRYTENIASESKPKATSV